MFNIVDWIIVICSARAFCIENKCQILEQNLFPFVEYCIQAVMIIYDWTVSLYLCTQCICFSYNGHFEQSILDSIRFESSYYSSFAFSERSNSSQRRAVQVWILNNKQNKNVTKRRKNKRRACAS